MKVLSFSLLWCLLLFGVQSVAAQAPSKVLPIDGKVASGRMANGFTYYIRENHIPKGQVHFAMVQKPNTMPFFYQIHPASIDAKEGINQMYQSLRDLRITSPDQYRPHLQGIIIVGAVNPDSAQVVLKKVFASLPSSVDVLQAQDVPSSIDSALLAQQFSARPMPASIQNTDFSVQIAYPLPPVSQEQRMSASFFVMDFLQYVLLHTANDRISPPYAVSADDAFILWDAPSPKEEISRTLFRLAGATKQMEMNAITSDEFARAKALYLLQVKEAHEISTLRSHAFYVEQCKEHFLMGIPMPASQWQFDFITQMVPFVTLDHANQYVKGIMHGALPTTSVKSQIGPADTLTLNKEQLYGSLLLERKLITQRLDSLLLPFDENEFMDLTLRLTQVDLRLYLDSLQESNKVRVPDADSLYRIFAMAPVGFQKIEPDKDTIVLPEGHLLRKTPAPFAPAQVWHLSNGSRLLLWPDTLCRGRVLFAAIQRGATSFIPFIPEETIEQTDGPLVWKQTSAGLLLEGQTHPQTLRTFVQAAAHQLYALVEDSLLVGQWWNMRRERLKAADELARTHLLDTLASLLFTSSSPFIPSAPKGFDYVFAGDLCSDSLQAVAEDFLSGWPSEGITQPTPVTIKEPVRRGIWHRRILYPNAAEENKQATVYSGPCPYTQEQWILLQLLEELLRRSTDESACIRTELESRPRGRYYLYIGYGTESSDADYQAHLFEQVLMELATYGPKEDQLARVKQSLQFFIEQQLIQTDFQRQILIRYASDGKDFLTGYSRILNQIDRAAVRDFVRQILENGNMAQVSLMGATNSPSDTSYLKIQ